MNGLSTTRRDHQSGVRESGLRERKKAGARETIFEAAMSLFAEKGFEATSVEEIAARAGVSRATYFNYFAAKEGVLRHYGQRLNEKLQAMAGHPAPGKSPLEQLHDLMQVMVQEAHANRDRLRLVYQYSLRDPAYTSGLTPARQQVWDLATDQIERAQAAGEVRRDMPARTMALHVLAVFQSATLALLVGDMNPDPLLASGWQFVLGGIQNADQLVK